MADPIPYTPDDLDIATKTLYGECRGEPMEGQVAVAWVIRNRVEWSPPAWWGDTISNVCLKPEQFSCWNQGDPNRAVILELTENDPEYMSMRAVAETVFKGNLEDPTKGSTSYERVGTGAYWAKNVPIAALIGNQEFFRLGADGQPF